MSRPRLLAHAFLAALLAASGPLGAQVGAYVSKFDRISPFADYGHVLSSSATGGFQEGGVTVSASFTEKSDITLGGPPAFIAMFATPLTFHIVASSEYQAPFSTDAGKTFTASMKITAVDDFKGSAPLACDLEASSVDVKQGQKATVSASLSCTATQLVWFNHTTDDSSYCQVLVDAFVVATAGSGGGTTFECWYKNRPNWDALSYFATSPTGSLGTGVPITFAGQAGITLNSTDSAQLQVSLVGEDGSTLATLPAINVTKTDALKTISLPPVTLAAVDQTLSLRLSLVGGDGKVLATAAVPYSAGPCVLTGLLRRSAGGTDWFLPDVPVSLLEGETVHGTVQTRQTGSIAHPKTEYCFAAADLPAGFSSAGKQLHLKAVLQDSLPPAMPMFTVSDKFFARPTTPLEIHWRPFSGNPSVNRKDLNVDRTADLQVPDGYDAQDIEASAEVYWHIWRQIHVMVPSASLPAAKRSPPLEIALHAEDTHYCPDAFGTRCPAASSIGVGNTDSLPGANPDVLWHEFGHHVLEEIYEAPAITPPGSGVALNHGGFANDYTSDSVEEGFATFWSAASSRLLSKDRNRELGLYRLLSEFKTEPITLETNYQASNPRRPEYSLPAPPHEELAVAGLLWDLLDTHAETETRYGVNLTDSVALGLTNVVALFDAKPNSVLKIYQTLKARYPGLAIDSVFLLHGLFYDKKGDFLYHEGDEVGRTANGGEWSGWTIGESVDTAVTLGPRPARESPKPIPGSFVKVALKGPDGSPVAVSQVEVSIEYGPGFEELSTTNTLLVTDGNVYFQMPPPDYRAKAVLRVAGSSGPALVIDGQAYWATPPGADHFAEQTFVVPPDVPQLDAVSPAFAPAGARLTLLGRNFASDAASNAVTFGSQTANVVFATATQLFIDAPAMLAGGTVPVVVTRAGKSSAEVDFDVVAPVLSVTPSSLNFGSVALGGSADKTLKIRNAGEAPLLVTSLLATGPFAALDAATTRAPATIQPGHELALTVRFTPGSTASAAGALVITTNDVAHRSTTVALTGSGNGAATPDAAVEPGAVGFGSVAVGKSADATVRLLNRGGGALTVSAVSFSSPAFALVSPAAPITVAAGGEQALTLRFTPTAAAAYGGTLKLATNDPDTRSLALSLAGTGTPAGTTPPGCVFSLTPGTLAVSAAASAGMIAVAAPAGCAWTAASDSAFVTLGVAGGSGSGSVSYAISVNATGHFRSALLRIAGVVVPVAQESEGSATSTVPIVLDTAGLNGSFFTSELTLTNRGKGSAIAEYTYTAAFGGGSGTASDSIPAGAQLIFPDALEYLRSLGIPIPATGNRGGTLRVRFLGLTSPSSASATVRTASVVPEGRAGLAYGSVPSIAALTGTSYLLGLRQNTTDRANVAVVNAGRAGDGDVVLRLTIFSGDPSSPASKVVPDIGLPPGGFAQISGILGSNGLSLANGWVKVEKVGGKAPYYAYAVINDQKNSDGSFVPPVTAESLTGKTGITLPVVVEVSTFSTELVVTNFGTSAKTFQVTLVADAVQAAGNAASVPFTLAPGEQRILPDFVQYLRDQHAAGIGAKGPTYAGAAFLSVASGDVSGLFIGARTSSPGGGGRYGLFYTGVPNGSAAGATPVYLYGLQQNADNRANVAFVNTGETDGSSDTLHVEIFDGATGFASRTFDVTLGPKRWTQASGVLTQYAPGVSNAYVRVTRTAGMNPFVAYAVVNDGGAPGQRSGDGAFITMDASN